MTASGRVAAIDLRINKRIIFSSADLHGWEDILKTHDNRIVYVFSDPYTYFRLAYSIW